MKKLIGKKEYDDNAELSRIATEILNNQQEFSVFFDPKKDDIQISYLSVYPYIAKHVVGRCIRSNDMVTYYSDYDYVIQVSGNLWDQLDDERKKILVWHELCHIEIIYDKKGNKLKKIKDHTIKDFYKIINKYGIKWFEELKTINSSVNDIEGEYTMDI